MAIHSRGTIRDISSLSSLQLIALNIDGRNRSFQDTACIIYTYYGELDDVATMPFAISIGYKQRLRAVNTLAGRWHSSTVLYAVLGLHLQFHTDQG